MIKFNTGENINTLNVIASTDIIAGHKRKIAIITTTGIEYSEAAKLFVDGAIWSIVEKTDHGDIEYNAWNDYTVAGPITDNRDGTLIVKMGKANTAEQDLQDEVKTKTSIITVIAGKSVQTTKEASAIRSDVESLFSASSMEDDNKIRTDYLCPVWKAGNHHKDENYTADNQIWECYQEYDNATYPDIKPGTPSWFTFNRPLHGKTPETARPFVPVQGSHDMYHIGEYMIYTDGKLYKCVSDTNFSPDDHAQDWEKQN